MNKIIKGRYMIVAVWIVAAVLLTVFQPDINAILRFRGQTPLSDDSRSVIADSILSKMETTKGNNNILVFYNENKLSKEDLNQINEGIERISESSTKLGISNIVDPFSTPEAEDSLISEDGTTLMVSFKLDRGDQEIDDIKEELESNLTNVKAEYYLSGEDFINEDYLKTALSGVEKSAVLTVAFILIVLMLMFRSVVTPLISLLAVGVSYLCSMGIAAQLIEKAGFPVTSLTQILLVLILFGIGTDYNILLFNRFKEEMSYGHSIDDSIINTYKTAGKTIVFSILTVFIAFLSLIFSESPIYQSGVVVVIAVVILLLEILTLTPFFMKVFGKKLFWPSKKISGHGDNRLWGKSSSFAVKHPVISVLAVLVIILPTVFLHEQKLNSNSVEELGDSASSSKGFNIVAEHFGEGQAMPASVVIENKEALDNSEALAVIDSITEKIKSIDGVSMVSSVTQPQSEQIEDFYVSSQMSSVTEGLSQTKDGVDQIAGGLGEASQALSEADFSQVNQIVDGTAKLQEGMSALSGGLVQIQNGISDGKENTQTIESGIAAIQKNLAAVSAGVDSLAANYIAMQTGFVQMGSSYQQTAQALLNVKAALAQMQGLVNALGTSYAGAASDQYYMTLKGTIDTLVTSLGEITPEGIQVLNENYNAATAGFSLANENLAAMSGGLSQMSEGLKQLQGGLGQSAAGIGTVITNMNNITDGLAQMKSGQQELADGLSGFGSFSEQLFQVNSGLEQISNGLGETNDFLEQLKSSKTFFVPKEALESEDFTVLFDTFMNKERTMTKLTVILKDDPYSPAALDTIDQINDGVLNVVNGSVLSDAKVGVSGPSAIANDLNTILNKDLNRMMIIVLIGILLVLILVIRSIWEPVVITASLLGAYYAAMYVLNFIFLDLKGLDGVQSFVPFFSLIIILALGVDYSIFLMMRFKEYPDMSRKEAIILASRHTGGIVMSAVLILGGTFATLIPSGFSILIQLAAAVIVGLILLCFIMLPIFLPAMISLKETLKKLFSGNKLD